MFTVPSSGFLKEFTLYADKISDEKETLIVTRSNGKTLVMMSLEEYNELKKEAYLSKANALDAQK